MAIKIRKGVATGGPDGQSSWEDQGDNFTLQAHSAITAGTTAAVFVMQTICKPHTAICGGELPDYLAPGVAIQTLAGFQVSTPGTAIAAQSTVSLDFSVYRNIGLGVALASGVAITQVVAATPLLAPIPSGSTLRVTNAAGNSTTFTTSALVAAGQTVIPINSATPGNAYATGSAGYVNGTALVLQVGNGPVFGWISAGASGSWPDGGAGAAGSGTPVFPVNTSVLTPAITANTALVNSMLPVAVSDQLQVLLQKDSSTVSWQIQNIQPVLV